MQTTAQRVFGPAERWLIAVCALAVVGLTGILVLGSEVESLRRQFHLEAHNISLQLSRRLAEAETVVNALHGFHGSADGLSAERFPAITGEFFQSHPQVRWIAYAEHLLPGDEAAFERRMQLDGFLGFTVHPLDEGGGVAGATMRLPLYLLEPLDPRRARFLGADVMSRSAWRRAAQHAIDSAEIHAFPTRGLAGEASGYMVLRATYRGLVEPREVVERRRQVSGLLMLFVDAASLLQDIETGSAPLQVRLHEEGGARHSHVDTGIQVELAQGAGGLLLPWMRTNLVLALADLEVHADAGMWLRPRMLNAAIAMVLAAMLVGSLVYGLRLQRVASLSERAAFEQAQLAESTLHAIGEGVIGLDGQGRVRYLNPVAERIAGSSSAEATGMPIEELVVLRGEDGNPVRGDDLSVLSGPEGTLLLERSGRKSLAVACTLSAVAGHGDSDAGHVLVIRDVSREHDLARELAFQARHDPLTELPNRREFEHRLFQALTDAAGSGHIHTLCYVDLDQFKLVNDTCGHAAGDQMLRQIAGLLASELRESDTLARLGGDEFGVLLIGCAVDRALVIAQRLCEVVAAFRFHWGERAFDLGASIGVVEINAASGTCDDLQRAADLACYAAKESGRSRVHLYCPQDEVISRNHREMQWRVEIKNALDEERFLLHAQPIRALTEGADPPALCELLLRLRRASGDLVLPMAFLPAAERYGLMPTVDRMVIEMAFAHIANAGRGQGVYTVNLSGQSLTDSGLGDFILAARVRAGIDPARVCFEVTETAAISHLGQAVGFMELLRNKGFRFALDDFGAGLSSFSYLKQLPLDFLKIDGQFVREIDRDPVARAMVSSIVSVARVLKLLTIAEMVDCEAARRCLQRLGVDYVQGNYIGPVVPAASRGSMPVDLAAPRDGAARPVVNIRS